MDRSSRKWGLVEWAAISTILGLVVALAAFYFNVLDRGNAKAQPSATSGSLGTSADSTKEVRQFR
jgi:hypothetical protein